MGLAAHTVLLGDCTGTEAVAVGTEAVAVGVEAVAAGIAAVAAGFEAVAAGVATAAAAAELCHTAPTANLESTVYGKALLVRPDSD